MFFIRHSCKDAGSWRLVGWRSDYMPRAARCEAIFGYYATATILGDVNSDSELAQEEIFGPVVALIKAKNFSEALDYANSTKYALAGGVFSRSPLNIERTKQELECGNMYINRGITGAMVDRHPFGGYKLSGIGSKTGGPDYLKQFTEPICITENHLTPWFRTY